MSFWIVQSLIFSKTWFLFRDDGTEIIIRVTSKHHLTSSLALKEEEEKYFKENCFPIKIRHLRFKEGKKITKKNIDID